ncbi:MAG: helix-turn-helix domain-containing protein [Pseudomonadota bacterium]
MELRIPIRRLVPMARQAQLAGIDLAPLLGELGLPTQFATQSRQTVSLGDYYRLQNSLALLLGDETLHFSARHLVHGSTDFVLQNTARCRSLAEAMETIAQSYNFLHGGSFNRVATTKATIDCIIDDRQFPYTAGSDQEYNFFAAECTLIFLHCMLSCLSAEIDDGVVALQVRRPTPGGDCSHLGYWDVPIRFGADVYRLSFRREVADAAIAPTTAALSSAAIYRKIVERVAGIEAQRIVAAPVAALVRSAFEAGVSEQESVAARLGVSIATLRRQLTAEGTSFRQLRRDFLNECARDWLRAGRSVTETAEALGFSDFRAFNRAFKEWNGVTPTEFKGAAKTDPAERR